MEVGHSFDDAYRDTNLCRQGFTAVGISNVPTGMFSTFVQMQRLRQLDFD